MIYAACMCKLPYSEENYRRWVGRTFRVLVFFCERQCSDNLLCLYICVVCTNILSISTAVSRFALFVVVLQLVSLPSIKFVLVVSFCCISLYFVAFCLFIENVNFGPPFDLFTHFGFSFHIWQRCHTPIIHPTPKRPTLPYDSNTHSTNYTKVTTNQKYPHSLSPQRYSS